VTYDVSRPDPSVGVTCRIEAQSGSHAQVGVVLVDVPGASGRTVRLTTTVRTSEQAVTGIVDECWVPEGRAGQGQPDRRDGAADGPGAPGFGMIGVSHSRGGRNVSREPTFGSPADLAWPTDRHRPQYERDLIERSEA